MQQLQLSIRQYFAYIKSLLRSNGSYNLSNFAIRRMPSTRAKGAISTSVKVSDTTMLKLYFSGG
jgi:hypothetical protein